MKGVFNHKFIASGEDEELAGTILLGCPLDATSSFRGGTRFAPESIRKASWTLETYSPYLKQDLDEVEFYDAGNLELLPGDLERSIGIIENAVAEIIGKGKKGLALGGEHLITYPVMKAMTKRFNVIQVVHFDAHCDLRDDYEGQRLSHATVMKRVKELGGLEVFQIGIRSGTRQEFEELLPIDSPASLAAHLDRNRPVYVTFDIDVFDPSLVPGVTTPEPGGLMFKEVVEYFSVLKGMNIVGADIVELAPDYDTTFVSSVTASKIAREILMLLQL
ncbi:MAG: Agmatinase [Syntrophorhabdaceae bacterium PtaU1.Bin034]|nr:MAG: Agmatinase [Syntrophorhabdaceae bacterium PtaU1.Bin034]